MKRFKDCAIFCNPGQSVRDLQNEVKVACINMGYDVEEYTSFSTSDTISVIFDKNELPISRLILIVTTEENCIQVINIVPDSRAGIFSLDKDLYNRILDAFKDEIFVLISSRDGNPIVESKADYTIDDIIPNSSEQLRRWLGGSPLSGHSSDQRRWFDFLIALIENDEYLSLDDFSNFIKETYHWREEEIEKFELKLEEELELLKYYNGNH